MTGSILLSTLLLFLVLNLLCSVMLKFVGKREEVGGWKRVPPSMRAAVYPDLGEKEREVLAGELANYKLAFQPFTHFTTKNSSGRYVNVQDGIRSLGKDFVWPPPKNETIVFGGSTTFGHSADHQTIAAYLQESLRGLPGPIRVYNMGCVFYYSTQERILFERFLQAGHVPHVAVFIDGVNEFGYTEIEVAGTDKFLRAFEDKARWPMPPVVKALQRLTGADLPPPQTNRYTPENLERIMTRYWANKKLIEASARGHGVSPVFVWQPVPTYKMELSQYPFKEEEMGRYIGSKLAYPLMAERVARSPAGDDFLWLADLQQGFKEPMYADQIHYSAPFSKAIGEAIGRFLVDRKIIPAGGPK